MLSSLFSQRFAWFVSDVTRQDFNWLLNSMVYGHRVLIRSSASFRKSRTLTFSPRAVFPEASEEELASLKKLGLRWKEYVKQGKIVYEEHQFWVRRSLRSLSRFCLLPPDFRPLFPSLLDRFRATLSGHWLRRVCRSLLLHLPVLRSSADLAVDSPAAPDLFIHLSESDLVVFKGDVRPVLSPATTTAP